MSLPGNRNPKTEVGTRDWDVAVIGLIMFLFGGMWTLVLGVTKAAAYFKVDALSTAQWTIPVGAWKTMVLIMT